MIRTSLTLAVALTSLAVPTQAENTLTPMDAPEPRPYPYEILGLQPGDPLDDVLALYAERSDAAPTSESEVLRVQSPDERSAARTAGAEGPDRGDLRPAVARRD